MQCGKHVGKNLPVFTCMENPYDVSTSKVYCRGKICIHFLPNHLYFLLKHSCKQKLQKTNEQTPSEEGETETKDTPVSGGKTQTKKSGKKQSENEAFKKRMREMYDAVQKYQV